MHLPGYEFGGPFTQTREKLRRKIAPRNRVDAFCLQHDLEYEVALTREERHAADRRLLNNINAIENPIFCERVGRLVINVCIRLKLLVGF